MTAYLKVFTANQRWGDLARFVWDYRSEGWAVVEKILLGRRPQMAGYSCAAGHDYVPGPEPRLVPQPTGIPNEPSLLTPTTAPLWPVITNAQCASPLSLGPNM